LQPRRQSADDETHFLKATVGVILPAGLTRPDGQSRIIRQRHKIAAFFHFLSGLIHYKLAFSLVVLIGCVQTFLTIHSGKLSIP
jgi:hypothetical protein